MGIYDRDYMRKGDPEEASRRYEEGRMDAEYGDARTRHAGEGRKAITILAVVIVVVIVLGFLCSL